MSNQEENLLKPRVRRILRIAGNSIRAGFGFLGSVISFLAASAQTSPADDELSSSIRGGELNHRTGKFDDGTDPAGIYKLD